jgi:hypothetical protein
VIYEISAKAAKVITNSKLWVFALLENNAATIDECSENILAFEVLFGWFLQDMAKIDKFNERILQELESNGHISNAEFADVVYLH